MLIVSVVGVPVAEFRLPSGLGANNCRVFCNPRVEGAGLMEICPLLPCSGRRRPLARLSMEEVDACLKLGTVISKWPGGNLGKVGSISSPGMADPLESGYETARTDTAHEVYGA